MTKSVLIYDGDCNFCMRWVGRLKYITKDRVEFLPSQAVRERFSQISHEDYKNSIQWVDLSGKVFKGAEAIFRALAYVSGRAWPLWIYKNVPGFALAAEYVYQIVAKNRKVFGAISYLNLQ